jgi:hypothetical protein
MFHRWAALVLVLALCAITPKTAAGQVVKKPREQSGGLGKNYPNPFNPETSIPFVVDSCLDGSRQHRVTLRIVNVLSVPVATFVLRAEPTSITPVPAGLVGAPISNLQLGCGVYKGFWSGFLPNGKEAPSGVYLAQLFVDGKPAGTQRMFNSK